MWDDDELMLGFALTVKEIMTITVLIPWGELFVFLSFFSVFLLLRMCKI
jgi:hypothetical protein